MGGWSELDHLIDLEHRGWDALSSGEGGTYYHQHLTEDALMAFPFGVLTREATHLSARGGGPRAAVTLTRDASQPERKKAAMASASASGASSATW